MEYKYRVRQTGYFAKWFAALRDCKPIDFGISEMRIDYGPGYRVYFVRREKVVIVLLAGGDKRSQRRDIAKAVELATSELE